MIVSNIKKLKLLSKNNT